DPLPAAGFQQLGSGPRVPPVSPPPAPRSTIAPPARTDAPPPAIRTAAPPAKICPKPPSPSPRESAPDLHTPGGQAAPPPAWFAGRPHPSREPARNPIISLRRPS